MNWLLATPIELRLILSGLIGAILGRLVNVAAARLATRSRPPNPSSSPHWAAPQGSAPPRWLNWIPVVGWLGPRREAPRHAQANPAALRSMLVELGGGLFAAWFYWWIVLERGIVPPGWARTLELAGGTSIAALGPDACLHALYAAQLVLIALMAAASLIDIDERIIPDGITIPGTLAALAAGLIACTQLPSGPNWVADAAVRGSAPQAFLTLASPNAWPDALAGGRPWSLVLGLACYAAWWIALLPRPWYPRHGWKRAARLLTARMASSGRHPGAMLLLAAGVVVIPLAWRFGEAAWIGLCSSLAGLAVGGGLIWAVRVLGRAVLGREAMGFGDVTLMAMIGAALGWQPVLVIFFVAPLFALAYGVLGWLLRGEAELFYGPFLCLAAVVVMIAWAPIWDRLWVLFVVWWLVPVAMIVALGAMGLLLWVLQVAKRRL